MADTTAADKELTADLSAMPDPTGSDGQKSDATPEDSGIPWMVGIRSDLAARMPLYINDWTCPVGRQLGRVASASLYAYFTSILPAVIFGDQLDGATDGLMAVPEVIMATGMLGVLYSIFAGQALVIVGVTGPVVFFTQTVYMLADTIDAPFLQFMGWIGVWSGLMHIVVAASGATTQVQKVTNFACEIFGFFISAAYIYLGVKALVELFTKDDTRSATCPDHTAPTVRESAFAGLILAIVMFSMASSLHYAQTWRTFNKSIREVIAQYGMVISIVFCTAISYLPLFDDANIVRLKVPSDYTEPVPSVARGSNNWFIDLMGDDMKVWQVFVAILPAVMLLILFFFDHNVSSILAQSPRFGLKKPSAFHWDFCVLGLTMVLCGFMGIPPGNGLIPQAPMHVRALSDITEEEVDGEKREKCSDVVETRWSAFVQSALCLLSLFMFDALGCIPHSVLSGTFIYMGTSGLPGNDLWERMQCVCMEPALRPDFGYVRNLEFSKVIEYTAVQAAMVLIIFFVSFNFFIDDPPIAILFPLLIAISIPLRTALERCFSPFELAELDRVAAPPGDTLEKAYDRTPTSKSTPSLDRQTMMGEDGLCMDDDARREHEKKREDLITSRSRRGTPQQSPLVSSKGEEPSDTFALSAKEEGSANASEQM